MPAPYGFFRKRFDHLRVAWRTDESPGLRSLAETSQRIGVAESQMAGDAFDLGIDIVEQILVAYLDTLYKA
jgi:hypothetical protein